MKPLSERTPLIIGLLALLLALSINTRVLPPAWRLPLNAIGGAIFVGLLVYELRRRPLTLGGPARQINSTCECGYDLRGTPPQETSQHFFDVRKRMASTRKIVICPECGKKQKLWEHH